MTQPWTATVHDCRGYWHPSEIAAIMATHRGDFPKVAASRRDVSEKMTYQRRRDMLASSRILQSAKLNGNV